jgi:predicted GIY-YIG superfamily endonuclease
MKNETSTINELGNNANLLLGNVIERFEMPKIGVYLLFNNDDLIYIGKSINIFQRLKSHIKDKYFDSYSFFKCDSEDNATKLEKELIIKLKPKLNIQHKVLDIKNEIEQNKEFTLKLENRLKYLNKETEYWASL